MRVDVDFNQRDRHGHVVTRVPAGLAAHLAVGQHVDLYDPPEKLWAEAVVSRINTENHIAAFDVDWQSFEDAEVSDVFDSRSHWSIGVRPGTGVPRQPDTCVRSGSGFHLTGLMALTVTGVVTFGGTDINIETGAGVTGSAGLAEDAVSS